ncbi:MAG: DUF1015 domain-containing protein [Deltaproteobacteria bacterium]|nr:DUF1015 domain-containing protein [Deltaproteobacteria bacterium]
MQTLLESVALHVPTILLPHRGIDLAAWAVIACDQYTSQPDYWQRVADFVGDNPSTLHLILPEVYLDRVTDEQIARINRSMQDCLDQGLLVAQPPGFILVERQTPHAGSRKGLMVALDLECYDYRPGSTSLIRASEGTIVERLPPRISVRRDAPLELPHIMVLIDDPDRTVIEPLFDHALSPIYDVELMLQAGRVRGYALSDPGLIESVAQALRRLTDAQTGQNCDRALLYAVGDGNHSLATAKNIWEMLKQSAIDRAALMRHTARYALVELVNLHDPGLLFEPIYRVLFNIQAESLPENIEQYFRRQGLRARQRAASGAEAAAIAAETGSPELHRFGWVSERGCGIVEIEGPGQVCSAGTLQDFLDAFVQNHPQARIDYVHGGAVVTELGCQKGNAGFYLPTLAKRDLFRTIMLQGALPRKTFSMGAAEEKRFYLECRVIR